jgi:hypothetical protein
VHDARRRDQSTPDNPPLLLPCNHVLCEQSVLKIAKSRTRVFKCPYCPVESRVDNLRALVFPQPGSVDGGVAGVTQGLLSAAAMGIPAVVLPPTAGITL